MYACTCLNLSCSSVLSPADDENHIDKQGFKIPFVCGARNLGEALRRIAEGASMIRTKGEAGTGLFDFNKERVQTTVVIEEVYLYRECGGGRASC